MSAEPAFEQIIVQRQGRRATISLNRPAKLNALTDQMLAELRTALSGIAADPGARVVVLKGEGRAFSAGYDMTPRGTEWTVGGWQEHLHEGITTFQAIWRLPQPVIAQIHGPCLGGAFEMSMACDLAVASSDAFFGLPEVRFGGLPMYPLLPWLIGMRPAKYITMTGERLPAAEAHALHLINKVVPPDELDRAVGSLCDTLAQIPAGTLPLNKQALNRGYEIMGLLEAIRMGEDQSVLNFFVKSEEALEFRKMIRSEGMKAAVAWLEARFKSET
jgi:enoyl-CoA hydratase